MDTEGQGLNSKIIATGLELLKGLAGEKPSVFERGRWAGRIIGWSLRNDEFRTRMLRFVDVFPALSTPAVLARHLKEYFGDLDGQLPGRMRWAMGAALGAGPLGTAFVSKVIQYSIEKLGSQFIVGDTATRALKSLARIRRGGCAFSIDILGEAVVSEDEADAYAAQYAGLIRELEEAAKTWVPLPGPGDNAPYLDWGYSPLVSISLKPNSLYSQMRPQNFQGSVDAVLRRLRPLCEQLIRAGGAMCIDMESYASKDISLEVYKALRTEYPRYGQLSVAMQAYLRETGSDLAGLLAWSGSNGLPIAVRLVKGAYWDYEVLRARQNGWTIPVYTKKAETDAAFERDARLVLEHHENAYLACGTHNIRSIAAVLEIAREIGVPPERYEFQVLYGMAEPVRRLLVDRKGRVRLYCPYGPIVPGMAYLVRRLLENTANQSFLRRMFSEQADASLLLSDPIEAAGVEGRGREPEREKSGPSARTDHPGDESDPHPFANQPPSDLTSAEERGLFRDALAGVRQKLGRTYPLFINGVDRPLPDTEASVNPADPTEVIGRVSQAGRAEVDEAIGAALTAHQGWRDTEPAARAAYLLKAAAHFRARRHEFAAWQVLEIGKQWDQASADVAEAIDFLEYYARQMERLGRPQALPSPPGERNYSFYEPRGVAVVIAPWNFPLAISCGMVSAAIVTGNCVVYKPSPLTPIIGRHLVEAFSDARLPAGVFNYVPGRTEEIAEYLIDHPDVSTIAFTGSTEVGLRIVEKAASARPGQTFVKRVICEMGGKNAIIIDEDADLDEAIPAVLASAFGFQGQKCSSCSRVIVVESIYDAFVERLIGGARSLAVGPAEDPAFSLGPVADEKARSRILKYIEIGSNEGRVLYQGQVPAGGNYVPLTILGEIEPRHRVAQEEIFGPVLAVMRAKTFEEALDAANSTRYALTGGVFSRSPSRLEEARRRFHVGNLYLNRHITGALVGRQPFGGFRLSGLGTKAGGAEYLLHYMDPRVVTENTARRGFVPDEEMREPLR